MRHFLLLIALTCAASILHAQTAKQRELGIYLNGVSHDGYFYRFGHDDKLWRLSLYEASVEGNTELFTDSLPKRWIDTNIAIGLGRESRMDIGDGLCFRNGWDVRLEQRTFTRIPRSAVRPNDLHYTLEINAILGLGWSPSDRFFIGVEVQPGLVAKAAIEMIPTSNTYELDFDYGGTYFTIPNRLLGSVAIRL